MADAGLLKRFNLDRALASQILFSHRHANESSPIHVDFADIWRCADEFVLIEAARGMGKTTLSEEFIILEGCYGNFFYLLLIGETYSKACQRLEAIDRECRANRDLEHLFGGPVLARKSIENRLWFKSGAMVEALGWEQELQGFKSGEHRPDRAYLDDIENLERVRDAAAVDAGMRKLFLELIPALDIHRRKIRFTQARRAQDCMVTRLSANNDWLYRAFPISDRDPDDPRARSNWPARYPMEWIRAEKARFQKSGMLGEFLQAYMLQVVDPTKKPFKDAQLAELDVSPYHWMPRYAIYDPSRSTHTKRRGNAQHKSDRTGKVVVSRMGSKILVHESGGYYWKPNELIDDLFAVDVRHAPVKIGVEKNSLEEWLMQPIRIEMLRRATPLPIITLKAPQDRSKEQFIMGLQPFAEASDIVLVGGRAAHAQLCAEWANFPAGPRDVINALAYALRMFGGTPMYEDFSGAHLTDVGTPRRGEVVYVGFNASLNEVVAVALIADGRRLTVAADWIAAGAVNDAVKTLGFEVRSKYPLAEIQVWVNADVYDQHQRIPLVPALRQEKFAPMRGEHPGAARGCLAERLRMTWRGGRLLMVDRNARGTLNALGAGYAIPNQGEPEDGISKLYAEAIECLVAMLDRTSNVVSMQQHANATSPSGMPYVSANPRARTH